MMREKEFGSITIASSGPIGDEDPGKYGSVVLKRWKNIALKR